ncbi:Isoprenyl transferase [subsurface metagenome]
MDLPSHVAIIPDGNRRYAQAKGLSRIEGHRRGADRMHQVVDELLRRSIKYLTLWGFSCDNWRRTSEEIESLFHLLALWIDKDTPWVHSKGIRLRHIGRLHELPQGLQEAITNAVTLTRNNSGMTLNVAFNYTGRGEIVDAVNRLIVQGIPFKKGNIPDVTEELFSHCLYTDGIPDVDLVIRTAGEVRMSNFMLWQTAYSEYYFTELLWPDFDTKELEKALNTYSERKRRFGGD